MTIFRKGDFEQFESEIFPLSGYSYNYMSQCDTQKNSLTGIDSNPPNHFANIPSATEVINSCFKTLKFYYHEVGRFFKLLPEEQLEMDEFKKNSEKLAIILKRYYQERKSLSVMDRCNQDRKMVDDAFELIKNGIDLEYEDQDKESLMNQVLRLGDLEIYTEIKSKFGDKFNFSDEAKKEFNQIILDELDCCIDSSKRAEYQVIYHDIFQKLPEKKLPDKAHQVENVNNSKADDKLKKVTDDESRTPVLKNGDNFNLFENFKQTFCSLFYGPEAEIDRPSISLTLCSKGGASVENLNSNKGAIMIF
jgi:hypothetical protein